MTYYHGHIYRPDCHICPLRYEPKVPPDGPIPARLVLVGEEPGDNEIQQGRAFVGLSGKLLWFLAQGMGLPPREEAIWTTNAALCQAKKIRLTTGAWLSKGQVKALAAYACRKRLLAEIDYVTQGNPRAVVVPLGNWALWATTGHPNPKIYAYRGSIQHVDFAAALRRSLMPSDAMIARASDGGGD